MGAGSYVWSKHGLARSSCGLCCVARSFVEKVVVVVCFCTKFVSEDVHIARLYQFAVLNTQCHGIVITTTAGKE